VHLVRVLPQAALFTLADLLWALLTADRMRAQAAGSGWTWNLGRWRDLRQARRQTQQLRTMGDGELRRLQARGNARVAATLRAALANDRRGRSMATMSRDLAGSIRSGSLRLPLAVWTVVAVVLVVGSRHLGHVPAVGQLTPFPSGP